MTYVIARARGGRPTLQHKVDLSNDRTICGLDTRAWSRAYQQAPIIQILCKRCNNEQ